MKTGHLAIRRASAFDHPIYPYEQTQKLTPPVDFANFLNIKRPTPALLEAPGFA
jgi:hypothetical protein